MNKHFTILWSLILTLSLSLSPVFSQKSPPAKGANAPAKPSADRQLTRPASPSPTASPTQVTNEDAEVAAPQQTASVPVKEGNPGNKMKRRTIAVLDFGDASLTDLKKNLGRQLALLLSNAFTKQGNFIVVERLQLDRVTDQLSKEEDTDVYTENALVQLGRRLKADALILGDITEFTATRKTKNYGFVIKTSYTAKLGLAVRLVDVSTGEVLDATNLEESVEEKGESNPFFSKRSELDDDLKVTLFTQAANKAVEKAVGQLDKLIQARIQISATASPTPASVKSPEPSGSSSPAGSGSINSYSPKSATAPSPRQPKIAGVEGTVVTLNVGKPHGVTVGSTFIVMRQGKVTKDPDTGEVLDVEEKEVGKIKITEVKEKISIGTLVSGSGVKPGDVVKQQ